MLDKRSKEDKQKEAQRCYSRLKARGRNSCAGCDLDFYCPMAGETSKWLFETFLPAIDPSGALRG